MIAMLLRNTPCTNTPLSRTSGTKRQAYSSAPKYSSSVVLTPAASMTASWP